MYKSKYENPYRQSTNTSPSLYEAPEITQSIKENDDIQTAEIEKGEIVAKPDLGALYKAQGKKHSAGGIKTYLEPDSFVYSNDKSMAFTKQEHELMELKAGGTIKQKNNTPAEVLKRNIDIKHYNKLINNIKDPIADDLAKKSSILMLSKYQEALGKIAYIQEAKKQFIQGVPEWAADTAPVYDGELKSEIKEQPQYMKYGGTYMNKMALGGNPYLNIDSMEKCPCGGVYPNCIPCPPSSLAGFLPKATLANDPSILRGMTQIGKLDNKTIYHSGTDPISIQTKGPKMSNPEWKEFLKTSKGRTWLETYNNRTAGTNKFAYTIPHTTTVKTTPGTIGYNNGPDPTPTMTTTQSSPYNPYVGMSRDQELNLAYSGLQAASVKRYDPYRQQARSPLVEMERMNEQGALNNIQASGNAAYAASRTVNPYLANAANMETTGKLLDSSNNVISEYANQNSQIANRQNEMNNQIQRGDLAANMGFDSKYYDQTVASRQNFDDLKSTANNEAMSLYNNYRGQNRQLQEFLSQQPIAGSVPVKDKKGKIIGYQDMPLYGYDSWSGNSYKTQAGNIMNARSIPQMSQMMARLEQLGKKIEATNDPRAMAVLYNSMDSFLTSKNSVLGQQYKKGGTYNPYQ